MLVTELPSHLLKPYAKSRTENHVQTIAFIQLVNSTDTNKAIDIALCENVVSIRTRNADRKWSKHADASHADFNAAKRAFLIEIEKAERRGFVCITTSGVFLPMNNTDLKHFRSSSQISRAALEYGTSLFDNITKWYIDERAKRTSAGSKPAAAPSTPPPTPPSSLPSVPPIAKSAADGDDFAKSLVTLETTLAKVTSAADGMDSAPDSSKF